MASKEPLYDAPSRSSVEVEQICAEHAPNPRDFYASDSPLLDEYLDPGQDSSKSSEEFSECLEPEVEDDDQVESSNTHHVRSSYLTCTSQANWRETFPATRGPTSPAFTFSASVLCFAFANCPAFVFSADVAFAVTNDSRNSTLTSR